MSIRVDIMNDAGDVLTFERNYQEDDTVFVNVDFMDTDTDPTPPAMKVSHADLAVALRSIGIG